MTAYVLLPLLLLINTHMQRLQGLIYPARFTVSVTMSGIAAFSIGAYAWFTGRALDFAFITDYRFLLSLICLLAYILVQMECRKEFCDNLPLLNFTGFLTLSVVPIISLVISLGLGFSKTLEVSYENPYAMYWLCGGTLILTLLYYGHRLHADNLNTRKLALLALHTLLGALSVVIGVKVMQEYEPMSVLLISNLFTMSVFFVFAQVKQGGVTQVGPVGFRPIAMSVACYLGSQIIGMLVMTNLPVEEYNLIRCIGLILMGYAYFYVTERKILFTARDILLLGLLLGLQLYFYRG